MVEAPRPNSIDPTLQELAIDNLNVQITIPEPSALGLLGVGLLGAWNLGRRRRISVWRSTV